MIFDEIRIELVRANTIHPPFCSDREGFDILDEEVKELRYEIRHGSPAAAREEAIQVAAMAVKLIQCIDREGVK